MKLYTEEQVRGLIEGYYDVNWSIQDAFDSLTPIELPSDEQISKESRGNTSNRPAFKNGAKWMRDKIQGGNK